MAWHSEHTQPPPAAGLAGQFDEAPADRSAPGESIRVLHVDDDAGFASMAAEHLERESDRLSVVVETGADDGLDRIDEVDCVVSDYEMPGMDGLEFLAAVQSERPGLPFILFTGKGSEEIAAEAISAGVTDYLQKETGTDQYKLLARRITNAVARRRARTDYRQIFQEVTDGVTVHDPESGRILDANRRFCDLLGYDREDLVGETIAHCSAVDEGYTDAAARAHVRRAAEEGTHRFEWVDRTASGERVPVEVTLEPTRLGGRDCVLAVVKDISKRKACERRIERLDQYREMVEAVVDGVYVLDADQQFTAVNDAMTRITGYGREELLGAHLSRLVGDSEVRESRRIREELAAADDRSAATMVAEHRTADGEAVPCEVRFTPRVGPDGSFRGTVGVLRDVSDRRARERELRRRNDRLEEFASLVAHDIRNPLDAAGANLDAVRMDLDREELDAAADALDRVERIVEETLRLARSGRTVGDPEVVSLPHVCERGWEAVDADATLDVRTAVDVRADPERLRRVLENLFRNAVQHGGPGVTVRVGTCEGGFYVADDGPGLPAEDPGAVFAPGYSTAEEGTGFGLAIVRRIVEAHGWAVTATASDDGGARFEITGVDVPDA